MHHPRCITLIWVPKIKRFYGWINGVTCACSWKSQKAPWINSKHAKIGNFCKHFSKLTAFFGSSYSSFNSSSLQLVIFPTKECSSLPKNNSYCLSALSWNWFAFNWTCHFLKLSCSTPLLPLLQVDRRCNLCIEQPIYAISFGDIIHSD